MVFKLYVMSARVAQRVCLLVLLGVAFPAIAFSAPALTLVKGEDETERLELSLDEIEALPQVTVVTENEFSDGEVAYRGPLMRDVLEKLAFGEAETLRFIAANDFFVDIPTSDFHRYDVILATEADGKKLSRRDKGPLWLMYPISDNPDLRDPIYVHRLIWQVVRIEPL